MCIEEGLTRILKTKGYRDEDIEVLIALAFIYNKLPELANTINLPTPKPK